MEKHLIEHDRPYFARPDLSPYLIHLTKNTVSADGDSAVDNLVNILKMGRVFGSSRKKGFIKGPNTATCFMDVPFASLKYILTAENCDEKQPRYEPYGIVITKRLAYKNGCRPVLYLSNNEMRTLSIPEDEKWRVVRMEGADANSVNWAHEREWRCKGSFTLPKTPLAVLVRDTKAAADLREQLDANPKKFKTVPKTIIPLTIMCQGLDDV